MKQPINKSNRILVTVAIMVLFGLMVTTLPATATILTNTVFSKYSVYRQVIGIVSAPTAAAPTTTGTDEAMELGAYGQDIAGTNNLVFRPGSLSSSQGLVFSSENDAVKLVMNGGQICLYSHTGLNQNVLNPGTDCKSTWPSISADPSLWEIVAGQDFGGGKIGSAIQPIDLTFGVQLGSASTPITDQSPIYLTGAGQGDIQAASTVSGLAANFSGSIASSLIDVWGALAVGDGVTNWEVWHGTYDGCPGEDLGANTCELPGPNTYLSVSKRKNDGAESNIPGQDYGLDADLINGNNVTISPGTSCTTGADETVLCFCLGIVYEQVVSSGDITTLNPNGPESTPVSKCLPLSNYR